MTELVEDLSVRTPDRRLAPFPVPVLASRQTVPFSSAIPLGEWLDLTPGVQAGFREALADRSPRQREALDALYARPR